MVTLWATGDVITAARLNDYNCQSISIKPSTVGASAITIRDTGDTADKIIFREDGSATLADRLYLGATDTSIYRIEANILGVDYYVRCRAFQAFTPDVYAISTRLDTDTEWFRLAIGNDGRIFWGPGNVAPDVVLKRGGVDILQTDDTFSALKLISNLDGNPAAGLEDTGQIWMRPALADATTTLRDSPPFTLTARYWDGTTSVNRDAAIYHDIWETTPRSTIVFQIAGLDIFKLHDDKSIDVLGEFRIGTNKLRTTNIIVKEGLTPAGVTGLLIRNSADTGYDDLGLERLHINSTGEIRFGGDTILSRPAANLLKTDDRFVAGGGISVMDNYIYLKGEGDPDFSIRGETSPPTGDNVAVMFRAASAAGYTRRWIFYDEATSTIRFAIDVLTGYVNIGGVVDMGNNAISSVSSLRGTYGSASAIEFPAGTGGKITINTPNSVGAITERMVFQGLVDVGEIDILNADLDMNANDITGVNRLYLSDVTSTVGVLWAGITGEASYRFTIEAQGRVLWGDGTGTWDVNLYRGTSPRAGDVVLRSDDHFVIGGRFERVASATGDFTLVSYVSGDSYNRLQICADGKIEWGSGAGAVDTILKRVGANKLQSDGQFNAATFVSNRGGFPQAVLQYDGKILALPKDADATNTLRDSPWLVLRGEYWDGTTSVVRDVNIFHRMLSTTPTSELVFQIAGADYFKIGDNGIITYKNLDMNSNNINNVKDAYFATAKIASGLSYTSKTAGVEIGTASTDRAYIKLSKGTTDPYATLGFADSGGYARFHLDLYDTELQIWSRPATSWTKVLVITDTGMKPGADNTQKLGLSTLRFAEGHFVNLYTGDITLDNGMVITEDSRGVIFKSPRGEELMKLDMEGNLYVKGEIKQWN